MQVPRWAQLQAKTRRALEAAGVSSDEQLAKLTNAELRAMPGIGPYKRKEIRALYPPPAAVQVMVPGPRGGMLNRGRAGKSGPTTREIRAEASREFSPLIGRLAKVANDRLGGVCKACGRGKIEVPLAEQLTAINLLGKFGPGTQREVVHALDREKAKDLIRALASGVQKHVLDEATQEAIAGEWEAVFFAFFPRQ